MRGGGAGVRAGFLRQAGLMAGLQVGQALRCSCHLGSGSAVPAPMFLGSQPPYTRNALIIIIGRGEQMEEQNSSQFFATFFRKQDCVGCGRFRVVAKKKKQYYQLRKQNG